jgi:hypothetical protein
MISQITGEDRKILSEVAADSMIQFIGHSVDIKRIADRLCYGSMSQAWGDIIEKGILELQKICQMDEEMDRLYKEEMAARKGEI